MPHFLVQWPRLGLFGICPIVPIFLLFWGVLASFLDYHRFFVFLPFFDPFWAVLAFLKKWRRAPFWAIFWVILVVFAFFYRFLPFVTVFDRLQPICNGAAKVDISD